MKSRRAFAFPPILLAHSSDDKISIPEYSVIMYLALQRAKVRSELHIFATGDQDFGVRQNEKLPSIWTQRHLNWLASEGLLKPKLSP